MSAARLKAMANSSNRASLRRGFGALLVVSLGVILYLTFARRSGTQRNGSFDPPMRHIQSPNGRSNRHSVAVLPPIGSLNAPVKTSSETSRDYLHSLLQANNERLPGLLKDMLLSGNENETHAVLEALTAWVKEGESSKYRQAAKALVLYLPPEQAVAIFVSAAEEVFLTGRSVISFSATISQIIDGSFPLHVDVDVENRVRNDLLVALVYTPIPWDSGGAGMFASIALGGAPDGHGEALRRLGELSTFAEDPLVKRTALVNLGRVGSLPDVLGATNVQIADYPDPDAALMQGELLGAIYNALTRHPEDVELAIPIYEDVLLGWKGREDLDRIRIQLLDELCHLRIAGLEDTLVFMTQGEGNLAVSRAAQRALKALQNEDDGGTHSR